MPEIAVIGGSGLYVMPGVEITGQTLASTPFGKPSGPVSTGVIGGREVVFLPRHGPSHDIPPHRINYRANVWALKELGAQRLISVSSAGGMSAGFEPGDIAALDQIIDMTGGGREGTFYDGPDVVHVDFTEPFCPELRAAAISSGKKAGVGLKQRCTYVCARGPRLESAAEIRFFIKMGADVVGMTAMPEAALARELEMCCLGLAVVTNHAAGISGRKLSALEVLEGMERSKGVLFRLLLETISAVPGKRLCACKDALKDARV